MNSELTICFNAIATKVAQSYFVLSVGKPVGCVLQLICENTDGAFTNGVHSLFFSACCFLPQMFLVRFFDQSICLSLFFGSPLFFGYLLLSFRLCRGRRFSLIKPLVIRVDFAPIHFDSIKLSTFDVVAVQDQGFKLPRFRWLQL